MNACRPHPRSIVNGQGLSLAGLACLEPSDRRELMGLAGEKLVEGQWRRVPFLNKGGASGALMAVSQVQMVGGKLKWVHIGYEAIPTGLPKGAMNAAAGINPMTYSPTINPSGRIIPASEKVVVGPIKAPAQVVKDKYGKVIPTPNLPSLQSPVASPKPKPLAVGEGEQKVMSAAQWQVTQALSPRVQTATMLTPPGSVNVVTRQADGSTAYLFQQPSALTPPATGVPVQAAPSSMMPVQVDPPAPIPFPSPAASPAASYEPISVAPYNPDEAFRSWEGIDTSRYATGDYLADESNDYAATYGGGDGSVPSVAYQATDYGSSYDGGYDGGYGGGYDGGYLDYAGLNGLGWGGFASMARVMGGAVAKAAPVASLLPGLQTVSSIVGNLAPLAASFLQPKGQSIAPQIMQAVPQVTQAVNSLLPQAATNMDAVNQIAQLISQVGAALAQDKSAATVQAVASGQPLPQGVFAGPGGRLYRIVPNAAQGAVQQTRQAAAGSQREGLGGNAMLMLGGVAVVVLAMGRRR